MINLEDRELYLGNKRVEIKCFEVWWLTIKGLCTTLDEALAVAKKTDMPEEMLRPIPVAIGVDGTYECLYK